MSVSLTPRPLYVGKYRRYPLNERLGGPKSRFGRFGEEKNPLPLSGFEPQTIQPIAFRYTDNTTLGQLISTLKNELDLSQAIKITYVGRTFKIM